MRVREQCDVICVAKNLARCPLSYLEARGARVTGVSECKVDHRCPQQGGEGVPLRGAAFQRKFRGRIPHGICRAYNSAVTGHHEFDPFNK